MGAHDDVRARRDPGAERHKLERVEPGVPGGDDGEAEVRVRLRVAVAGEMFERGEHTVLVQSPHVLGHETRDGPRILAERAHVDNRVRRIVVDVRVGREIQLDADRPPFDGRGGTDLVSVPRVARSADGHDLWKRGGTHHPHSGAPFQVGRDQKRQPGAALQRIELRRDVER